MNTEFVALPVGWANFYRERVEGETAYWAEPCSGVITTTETVSEGNLAIRKADRVGYASLMGNGTWAFASRRDGYIGTYFVGEGTTLDKETFVKVFLPQVAGNLWKLS